LDDCHQIFLQNEILRDFSCTLEAGIFKKKKIFSLSDEGHYSFRKKEGSALTETENWDLLVDCTSRDGRQMLDAGKRKYCAIFLVHWKREYLKKKRFSLLSLKSAFYFFHYTRADEDKAR
jgi:hypothetical protein